MALLLFFVESILVFRLGMWYTEHSRRTNRKLLRMDCRNKGEYLCGLLI